MATKHDLQAIDRQIIQLWALYRLWHKTGMAAETGPLEALGTIDALLEQRRDLTTTSLGEMHNRLDVADAYEWGAADTGQP